MEAYGKRRTGLFRDLRPFPLTDQPTPPPHAAFPASNHQWKRGRSGKVLFESLPPTPGFTKNKRFSRRRADQSEKPPLGMRPAITSLGERREKETRTKKALAFGARAFLSGVGLSTPWPTTSHPLEYAGPTAGELPADAPAIL